MCAVRDDGMIVLPLASSVREEGAGTVCVDPVTDPLWWRLVEKHRSDIFHSPEWMQVLSSTYGFDMRALVTVDDSGEPSAGIPFVRVSDFLGERLVCVPFSDYCDPLADDLEGWDRLASTLLMERLPIAMRCLHSEIPLTDERFALVKRAKWNGLNLHADLDDLWHGFDESARRAIKKAQRDGVIVRAAEREDDLRAFFQMHAGIRKYKYRLLAQPYRFFEQIWHHIIEQHKGRLMLATLEGEIIGGVMFLEWKDTLYYKFNASSPTSLSHRPNDLVVWEGIQYAKARGLTFLDFGLSDWDQNELVRYKRKYAREEKTISFLRYEPNGRPTQQETELRYLLGQLTELFVDESVSDRVTEAAGAALYRFFI